jgi:zinc transport system ATP-binding protein
VSDTVLELKKVRVVFEAQRVLDDVSFSLERGDSLAIIGPNGAGKTVLLRAILRMVPHSGRIELGAGIRLGYVPQRVQADPSLPLTIEDLLNTKVRLGRLDRSQGQRVAELVGLSAETMRLPLGRLSGGHLQKALIAFALLGEPNLVLFDEPTTSLDRPSEEHVFELIRRLQEQLGLTTVVVSHDMSIVYRFANKVLCLNRQGVCFGPPREALTPEALERLYGAPHRYYRHEHPT